MSTQKSRVGLGQEGAERQAAKTAVLHRKTDESEADAPDRSPISDDAIFGKAMAFLQETVDEALQEPEVGALVTNMVLDRVGGIAEDGAHTPPVPAQDDLVVPTDVTRDWLLK